jgi:tetratricopeptide (TPR) repeat protein
MHTFRLPSVDPSNKLAAYRLGWCYNEQKVWRRDMGFEGCVRLDPTDEKARRTRLRLPSAERYQEAIETYRGILTINPKSIDAHYYIGWIQNERGDYPAAIDALKEAVRLDPERGEAFEDLGYAYRQSGKFGEIGGAYLKRRESRTG